MYYQIILDNNTKVFVEESESSGLTSVGVRDFVQKNINEFKDSLIGIAKQVEYVKNITLNQLKESRPSHLEVELGVKLSSELGAVIAKAGIEGQLIIKLKWESL